MSQVLDAYVRQEKKPTSLFQKLLLWLHSRKSLPVLVGEGILEVKARTFAEHLESLAQSHQVDVNLKRTEYQENLACDPEMAGLWEFRLISPASSFLFLQSTATSDFFEYCRKEGTLDNSWQFARIEHLLRFAQVFGDEAYKKHVIALGSRQLLMDGEDERIFSPFVCPNDLSGNWFGLHPHCGENQQWDSYQTVLIVRKAR